MQLLALEMRQCLGAQRQNWRERCGISGVYTLGRDGDKNEAVLGSLNTSPVFTILLWEGIRSHGDPTYPFLWITDLKLFNQLPTMTVPSELGEWVNVFFFFFTLIIL